MSASKKDFCLRDHEIAAVGRNNDSSCRQCKTDRGRLRWWKEYGITNPDGTPFTSADFDRNYQIQGGKCKGCDTHQSQMSRSLAVDHDHTTGFFRALLCMNCNRTLGHAQDSPAILRKLADLLEGI